VDAVVAALRGAALGAMVCCGCEAGRPGLDAASASASAQVVDSVKPKRPPPPPVLKPLVASGDIVPLEVPGFAAASVSVPRGATQPRPLIIVLHGESDLPERQCREWRRISGGYPWVLCPRGTPRSGSPAKEGRFTYASPDAAAKELRAALAALKDKYVYHVAPGSVVLVGYSLGARYAIELAKQEPSFFSRVVLVEGGGQQWASGAATLYQRGGGQRVLFACREASCRKEARDRVALSQRLGLKAKVVAASGSGHVDDGAVADGLRREYRWLTQGDPRFRGGAGASRPVSP